jgi:hypothetical protein
MTALWRDDGVVVGRRRWGGMTALWRDDGFDGVPSNPPG